MENEAKNSLGAAVESPRPALEQCKWTQGTDIEAGVWWANCGDGFTLETGTPEDNKMKFCCYCGLPLAETPLKEGDDDEPSTLELPRDPSRISEYNIESRWGSLGSFRGWGHP